MLSWLGRLAAVFILGAAAGAWVMSLVTTSAIVREDKFREEIRALVSDSAAAAAATLDAKLSELHGNEIRTERVIHTETVKPVFRNVCATDDYVRLFNDGTAAAARTLAGGNVGTVPGSTADAGRANGQ